MSERVKLLENAINDERRAKWLADIFGSQYQNRLEKITNEFYRLAFVHKPEYMGGGIEWNNDKK